MSFNYNRVTIGGNLTRDPEIRYVGTGDAVCKITIAVNHKTKNAEQTTFIDCVVWGKSAETVNTYFKKGKPILVDGRLSIRSYDDKDGNKRKATEVVVDRFTFIPDGTRGESNGNAGGAGSSSTSYGSGSGHNDFDAPLEDDEIPF